MSYVSHKFLTEVLFLLQILNLCHLILRPIHHFFVNISNYVFAHIELEVLSLYTHGVHVSEYQFYFIVNKLLKRFIKYDPGNDESRCKNNKSFNPPESVGKKIMNPSYH